MPHEKSPPQPVETASQQRVDRSREFFRTAEWRTFYLCREAAEIGEMDFDISGLSLTAKACVRLIPGKHKD